MAVLLFPAGFDCGYRITALSAYAGDEQGDVGGYFSDAFYFCGIGCAYDQA